MTTFNQQTGTANPFNGIDVGIYSHPTFADIDGDGDLDAIVGAVNGTLLYYQNTGTATNPTYTQQTGTANPFNGISVGNYSTPTLADIDGDGDLDAIVGAVNGTLRYYQNTGTATNPTYTQQTGTANPFNGISVGNFSSPTLADIDGDGDLDAIVGAVNGTLRYYQNTGTATNPTYTQQTGTANPFNGISVGSISSPTFGDIDGDGDLDAIVGKGYGTLFYYKNTGTATNPTYTEQTGTANPFNGVDVGNFSSPTLADIDGDGDLDAIVGANDGTLRYYENVPSNRPPVAVNDAVSTNENTVLNGNLLAANPTTPDSDPDGNPLTVTQVNGSATNVGSEIDLGNGKLTVNTDGTFSFNPNGGYESLAQGATTTESFTYTISDGFDGTASATATITINGVNDAPIANNNSGIGFSTDEDNAFTTANVLSNDTDVDSSDVLTVTNLNTTGTLGLVTNNGNGTFSYNPNRAFESLNNGQAATDSFTYTVSDGKGGTNTATVTVNIAGVTDVPITIQAESLTNISGYRIENNAIAEGGSMLSLINGSANEVGTATFTFNGPSGLYNLIIGTFDENDGQSTFTLTQQGNAVGSILLNQDFNSDAPSQNTKVERLLGSNLTITNGNSFTITGFENQGEGARLDFIRFVPVGLAGTPVAVNDSATTAFNTAVSIPVSTLLANDTDPNGDSLSITSVSGVANGNAILNNNGTPSNTADDFVLFTPITGFTGNGSFNYTLSDGSLTATATVTVAVGANIVGGNGNDSINGGVGNDSINGGNGNDSINGGAGNDIINGGNGNDILYGDGFMNGGTGNDTLLGGNGDDILYGGLGSDILTGGNGKDTFAFAAGDGTDTITDFGKGSDLIGLYNGLSFGQLSFSSSNILVTSTNEILATLTGINTTTLTAANFVTL